MFTKTAVQIVQRNQSLKADIMTAMKADAIPEGWSNLWFITKAEVASAHPSVRFGKDVIVPPGTYTHLFCVTDSTVYSWPPGELVMEDTPFELSTHLGFALNAYGKVLVTGLGLGCVTRGLLANPKVEHVTVIENSPDVIKLVASYMPQTDRLTIVEAEAREWASQNKDVFDCGWHDLWTNKDKGEPHLDFWHTELLMSCRRFTKQQGAWALNRITKKKMQQWGFPWMG
jgi:hypothetical protein